MDTPFRPLTEARIRELFAGMPAFHAEIHKLGRKKSSKKPLPLPSAENLPADGTIVGVAAEAYSEDPNEVAFYRDTMRLQELFILVTSKRMPARERINASIASLRAQTASLANIVPDADMAGVLDSMVSSRLAEFESITDEELGIIARLAPEIEKVLMHGFQNAARGRRRRR